jgi:hypothetical protein
VIRLSGIATAAGRRGLSSASLRMTASSPPLCCCLRPLSPPESGTMHPRPETFSAAGWAGSDARAGCVSASGRDALHSHGGGTRRTCARRRRPRARRRTPATGRSKVWSELRLTSALLTASSPSSSSTSAAPPPSPPRSGTRAPSYWTTSPLPPRRHHRHTRQRRGGGDGGNQRKTNYSFFCREEETTG